MEMKWKKGRRPEKDDIYIVYIPYPNPKEPKYILAEWEAKNGWGGMPQGLVPEITEYCNIISPQQQRKRRKRALPKKAKKT
jgi:hypothetical protein